MRFFFLFFCLSCVFPFRLFAASCSYNACDYLTYSVESLVTFDCEADLIAAWEALNIAVVLGESLVFTGNAWVNGCMGVPDGTRVWFGRQSDPNVRTFYILCPGDTCSPDDCESEAVAACGSADMIIWAEGSPESGCEYACKDGCDVEQAYQDSVAACGTAENVVWDNVDTCTWHCDQDDCEDEYQAAKQQCEKPFLLDRLTCEYICECEENRRTAEEHCTAGYYFDRDTCEWDCKCCGDKYRECSQYCGGDKNVKPFSCSDSTGINSNCVVDLSKLSPCECIVPPITDPKPDPEDPPEPPNCANFEAACSANGCKPSCISDPDTGFILSKNCDCGQDPTDPGPDGEIGTPDDTEKDDLANGWLKAIEENTDKTASAVNEASEKNIEWLKAIKHNVDAAIENDKRYFLDSSGKPYLKTISEKLDSLEAALEGSEDDLVITTVGSGTLPLDNVYSTTFTQEEGFEPLPEDTFSQELSDYIASGIPLISYIKDSSINLSSASSVLSLNLYGRSYSVDFSRYVGLVDSAGNILLALTVLSSFMIIIGRAKG